MAIEIIRRRDALAQGHKRYFTGKPCKHGHVAERMCHDRRCRECNKKRFSENAQRYGAQRKRYHPENIHKAREYSRKWRTENREKRRLYNHNRRARELNADSSYTVEQIRDLFKKQKGKCLNCRRSIKRGYHTDHIVALARGGSNDIRNIQLLCQPCNNRKHAKDPIMWAQQNGRLL